MPRRTVYEMRLMADRYGSGRMIPDVGDRDRLTAMPARPTAWACRSR